MIDQGYLIVLKPEVYIARYEASDFPKKQGPKYDEFRRCFAWFDYRNYRGMSRAPLGNPSFPGQSGAPLNNAAIKLLTELLPQTTVEFDEESLIDDYNSAMEVYALLEDQDSWEVIEVRRCNYGQDARILGYDVGYWNMDHYSLIADTAITPMWHGPAREDWTELATQLARLNKNNLFDSPSEAEQFRSYYRSKNWAEAESEPGEFAIVEVRNTDSGL